MLLEIEIIMNIIEHYWTGLLKFGVVNVGLH